MRKIAYDLHGVISAAPEKFKAIMKADRCLNKQVWVISGPPLEQVEQELDELKLVRGEHYDHVVGVVSYLNSRFYQNTVDENGHYWFEEDVWWKSKHSICKDYCIDVLYDNDVEYGYHFGDRIIRSPFSTENCYPTQFILTRVVEEQIYFFELKGQ